MPELAARGGPAAFDYPGPHYQWPIIDDQLDKAILTQMRRSLSDRDAHGVIGDFERAFADFVGAAHAVSFSSGTGAIHAMSRVLGLGPGDAVIAPAYTFLATASPFAFEGVRVIFADADEYGNVTADTLSEAWQPQVRAVIITHMWGNPCRLDDITAFCRQRDLALLEDCSHAHFASYRGHRVGSLADMAVYSTNQKAITTGEGGVLTTASRHFYELALLFGHYNKRCMSEIDPETEYYPFAFTGMGLKYRMTTLAAAIGVDQLTRAGEIERRRRDVLRRLVAGLDANPVVSPIVVPSDQGQHGLYVFGLRFHPEAADVTRDEFAQLCVAEGAREVDVPGSTCDISAEPLFARAEPHAPYRPCSVKTADLPGVRAFQDTFLKIPLWGYDGDEVLVEGYLAAIAKVSEAVTR
jgi:dTDP-4-amino-4,6-dideoxygalactose transaminase